MVAVVPASDPSMDEILASIRKIISSDLKDEETSFALQKNPQDEVDNEAEDILDLTEALPEENQKTKLQQSEKNGAPAYFVGKPGEHSPAQFEEKTFSPENEPLHASTLAPASENKPAYSFEASPNSIATLPKTTEALYPFPKLSQETPKSSDTGHQEEKGGQTVENLVSESLKPLLKEWLDIHLPSLVRSIVTEQIEKILHELGIALTKSQSGESKK